MDLLRLIEVPLYLVPTLLISLLPCKYQPKRLICLLLYGAFLGVACVSMTSNDLWYGFTALIYLLAYLPLCGMPYFKGLFWFFASLHYLMFSISVSNYLETCWLGFFSQSITPQFIISFSVLQLICLPIAVWILYKYLLPVFTQAVDARMLHLLFLLPLTQCGISLALTQAYVSMAYSFNFSFLLINLISYAGTLISYCLCAQLIQENLRAGLYKARLELAGRILEAQKEKYVQQSADYEKLRVLRHNLKYQLGVLRACLERKEYDRLQTYLDDWELRIFERAAITYSDHPAVDSVIHALLGQPCAQDVRTDIVLPLSGCGIDDADLCVLIGNSLQNALEACSQLPAEDRFVQMRGRVEHKHVTLLVMNHFDGQLQKSGEQLLSRKRSFASPGIGLASIQAIAKQYTGVTETEYTDHEFTLKVFLQAP